MIEWLTPDAAANPWRAHVLYGLAWLTFGLSHSYLASQEAKDRFHRLLGAYYRLSYNLLSIAHVGGIVVYGWLMFGLGPTLVPEIAVTVMTAAAVLGWIIAMIAVQSYSFWRLSGLRQIWDHVKGHPPLPEHDNELITRNLHRYVRHPIYTGMILLIWGQATDPLGLITALWASAYLLIGTWFEERKLVRTYGIVYEAYRRRVPAVIPWKGRAWTPAHETPELKREAA